jgi:hypothetical protein
VFPQQLADAYCAFTSPHDDDARAKCTDATKITSSGTRGILLTALFNLEKLHNSYSREMPSGSKTITYMLNGLGIVALYVRPGCGVMGAAVRGAGGSFSSDCPRPS